MTDITQAQKQKIRQLVRAANRRLERAYEQKDYGQARALEYYIKRATGKKKWSAATKGFSSERADALITKLNKFMEGESTKRTGWKRIKAQNVRDAVATLKKKKDVNYTLTEEELSAALEIYDEMYADVVIHSKEESRREFYYVVNKVQAAKTKAKTDIFDNNAIVNALMDSMTPQQAMETIIDK